MKRYRNEWKYCCMERNLAELEGRVKGILRLDDYATENGKYVVHSLYFDDRYYSCAHATEMGLGKRYKYRIRFYRDSVETLRLEKKEKVNGKGRKLTCPLSLGQYEAIINRDISTVFWNTDNPVLKQFCIDIWKKGLEPKAIIDYDRVAYVEDITNVRVTFDQNITVSGDVKHFLDGGYLTIPLLESGEYILEVKFDEILPGSIKKVIYIDDLQQTSFSKYYIGLNKLITRYDGVNPNI